MIWFYSKDGRYYVAGNTFYVKDKLKDLGAVWDPSKKLWSLAKAERNLKVLRDDLGLTHRVRVKHEPFCHESSGFIYIDKADAQRGWIDKMFCGNCDSMFRGEIKVEELDD